jgi:hypothetical protein
VPLAVGVSIGARLHQLTLLRPCFAAHVCRARLGRTVPLPAKRATIQRFSSTARPKRVCVLVEKGPFVRPLTVGGGKVVNPRGGGTTATITRPSPKSLQTPQDRRPIEQPNRTAERRRTQVQVPLRHAQLPANGELLDRSRRRSPHRQVRAERVTQDVQPREYTESTRDRHVVVASVDYSRLPREAGEMSRGANARVNVRPSPCAHPDSRSLRRSRLTFRTGDGSDAVPIQRESRAETAADF